MDNYTSDELVKLIKKEPDPQSIENARKEGRKEGRKEAKKEIAKKLKEIHTPEEIAKITGLKIKEIRLL